MAWVCVGYNGEELIFSEKPHRCIIDDINDNMFIIVAFYKVWESKHNVFVELSKGSIKKLIGRELT